MRILMIGDIIGSPGRKALGSLLPSLRQEYKVNLVVANGENTAGGFGLTLETAHDLLDSGVDVITSGNHIWDQKEIIPHMNEDIPVVRPENYPSGVPGRGHIKIGDVLVLNLMGRVFMTAIDCPFRAADKVLESLPANDRPKIIVIDFHAEATSEKAALAWYLDGRVSAIVGTHTHVATADTRILPKGTAFVSDLGMTGPINSIIGSEPTPIIERFLTQTPRRFTVVTDGPLRLNSVLIDIDEENGKATDIQRVDRVIG